ncbi:hypothetical protein HRR78_002110 [Exophiala dermatitidis]|nr:hypothetical protein HRR78_002110 [Exophiala dermatitidis]
MNKMPLQQTNDTLTVNLNHSSLTTKNSSERILRSSRMASTKQGTPASAAPTGASHQRSDSGISDDAAKSAHEFMTGTIRRSSSGVTDEAAEAAHDFMRTSKGTGPGLNDDLTEKAHKFLDGPATHRESHSKYLPDVTLPGVTDEIAEEALEFVDGVEKTNKA